MEQSTEISLNLSSVDVLRLQNTKQKYNLESDEEVIQFLLYRHSGLTSEEVLKEFPNWEKFTKLAPTHKDIQNGAN